MAVFRTEAFLKKVAELGLDELLPNFTQMGITTMAKLAFANNVDLTSPDIKEVEAEVLSKLIVINEVPNTTHMSMLRILWWACYAETTEDMKQKAAGTTKPRQVTGAELAERRDKVAARLPGLTMCPELTISDQLLRRCMAIYDSDRLAYIPWEKCTSMPVEVIGHQVTAKMKRGRAIRSSWRTKSKDCQMPTSTTPTPSSMH